MPRNGNGTYTAPPSSWNPAINGNAATQGDWNVLLNDISTALTQSLSRDGQTPMGGNFSLGGNRIINLGQPVDDHDALRRSQIIKGTNIASAASLPIPMEGAMFDVTGSTTITGLSDTFPGRIVVLRFQDSLTITNSSTLVLRTGSNIRTQPFDIAVFVNTQFGVWVCISYSSFSSYADVWLSQPIGVPFPIWDHLSGTPIPPNDTARYRYIKLTYQDSYNSGVLINQTRTGSGDPFYESTAQVSLASSPINGQVVRLINTERAFIRPGPSGATETSAFGSHAHTASTGSAGAHTHPYEYVQGSPGGGVSDGSDFTLERIYTNTGSAGAHTHPVTVNSSGSNETRPRNVGATYYMRIL